MTTSVHTLELGRALDPELSAELEKLSTWVSPRVRDVRVERGGRSVCFTVDGAESAVEGERAKVARFVADLVERHRVLPRRVVAQRTRRSGAAMDVYDELVRRGWVVECGAGRVSLRGPALRTVQALDEDCARIAVAALGAVEEAHASLVPASLLARCGWFGSFPQTASFVAHLAEDYDAIERFRCSNVGEPRLVPPVSGALATIDASLLPALCYAVYAAREGSVVPSGGLSVTCAGRCFRYESRNMNGLERLWEFSMREVVFLGDEEAVESRRARAIDLVMDQLERWDLDGAIETANDPFFPAAHAARAHWQRSGERKLELRLPVGGAAGDGSVRTAACASLNLHDRFFGSAFAIGSAGGEAAASGCVGWGMERWMLACFAQHGLDPEAWPRWLRSRVFR